MSKNKSRRNPKRGVRRVASRQVDTLPLAVNDLPINLPEHIRDRLDISRRQLEAQCSPEELRALIKCNQEMLIKIIRQYGINPPATCPALLILEYQKALDEARHWKGMGPEQYLGSRAAKALHIERQRKRSQLPRQDSLQRLIIQILKATPEARSAKVIAELRKHIGGSIEQIMDGVIEWHEEDKRGRNKQWSAEATPLTGLKDRIYRARKFLKNSQ